MRSRAIPLALIALLPTRAAADITINVEPGFALPIGRNGVPLAPSAGFSPCMVYDAIKPDNVLDSGTGPIAVNHVQVFSSFTTDTSDLIGSLGIDMASKASASLTNGLSASVKSEFSLKTDYSSSSDNASYMLSAIYDFGSRSLDNARLKPEYADFLSSGKIDKVKGDCGTHYARTESRWAYVQIIANSGSIAKSLATHLKTSFSAEGKLGEIASANASLTLEAAIKTMSRYGNVTLDVRARGGDPAKLAPLIAAVSAQDTKAIIDAVQQYVATFTYANSVARQVWLTPLPGLAALDRPALQQVRYLREQYSDLLEVNGALHQVNADMEDGPASGSQGASYNQDVQRRAQSLQSSLEDIESGIRACLADSSACHAGGSLADAPESFISDNLLDRNVKAVCLYKGGKPDAIDVTADMHFVDLRGISSVEVYRRQGYRSPVSVGQEDWKVASDPETGRVTMRIDHFSTNESAYTGINDTSYEVKVISVGGRERWQYLGKPALGIGGCKSRV